MEIGELKKKKIVIKETEIGFQFNINYGNLINLNSRKKRTKKIKHLLYKLQANINYGECYYSIGKYGFAVYYSIYYKNKK